MTSKPYSSTPDKPSVRQKKRDRYWPNCEERLWLRKIKHGFTTLPKTMPLILEIMERALKGGPALSKTYLALWCNTWDDHFIEVRSEDQLAFESGFAQSTLARRRHEWRKRMAQLEELGFISAIKSDVSYQYVILWNPHQAVKALFDKHPRIGDALKNALLDKATDIGAEDLLNQFKEEPDHVSDSDSKNSDLD